MLVGITIDRYKGINPSVLLKVTRKIGLEFVEITKTVFDDLPNVLYELGSTKTGFHLPHFNDDGFDFSCVDHADEIKQLIKLINKHHQPLNIQYCVSHPPECQTSFQNENNVKSILFKNLKKIRPPLIIENIASLSRKQFVEFYSLAKMELGTKLLGQCYDAAHYFVSGENPVSILDSFDGEIKCVHLSDCKRNDDLHLPFDLGGELPVEEILNTLKLKNYTGIINLELLPRSLSELEAVINSYLKVLNTFKKIKYFSTRMKLFFFMPILRRILSMSF